VGPLSRPVGREHTSKAVPQQTRADRAIPPKICTAATDKRTPSGCRGPGLQSGPGKSRQKSVRRETVEKKAPGNSRYLPPMARQQPEPRAQPVSRARAASASENGRRAAPTLPKGQRTGTNTALWRGTRGCTATTDRGPAGPSAPRIATHAVPDASGPLKVGTKCQ
jgi:hypothetical protein